jgi:hypothetical protein
MDRLSNEETEFAYHFLSDRESYHHHKEQMAYIGFLIETAFFTAVMTFNWQSSEVCPQFMLLLAVPFWAVLHLFIRWQLRLRRFAAFQIATLLSAILKDLAQDKEKPKSPNMAGQDNSDSVKGNQSRAHPVWVDYLIPCPSARVFSDVDIEDYPRWYQNEFRAAVNRGAGAILGEQLVTCGSWLILVFMIMRLTLLW